MSTETIYKCNFCGDTSDDMSSLDIMKDDWHICERCSSVVVNLLYEASVISQQTPETTAHAGQAGLWTLIESLKKEVRRQKEDW